MLDLSFSSHSAGAWIHHAIVQLENIEILLTVPTAQWLQNYGYCCQNKTPEVADNYGQNAFLSLNYCLSHRLQKKHFFF